MEDIREYLIGVIAAALLCGIVSTLTDGKSTMAVAVKLVSGFLMLLAVLRPWVNLQPGGLFSWVEEISYEGAVFVAEGEELADDFYRESITEHLKSYILEEASRYDCNLSVEILLSDDGLPTPKEIHLSGAVSPYARQAITNSLMEHLGLSREDLIWT